MPIPAPLVSNFTGVPVSMAVAILITTICSAGVDPSSICVRKSILISIQELIREGETDPSLFELLGVFQEGIGCDRVSDLITFILDEDILNFTERVLKSANIVTSPILYKGKEYNLVKNPYSNEYIRLLPSIILSPLPTANEFSDIDIVCAENERIRTAINKYFDFSQRKKISKSEILSLMHSVPIFRRALIETYKSIEKRPYDFSTDPAGEYIWFSVSKEFTEKYPIEFGRQTLETIDDVLTITEKICIQFRMLIEDNGLNKLLFDETGKPKKEGAAQLLFFGIADSYCSANDLDLTKEGNNGHGPADFKISRGASDKVVVETKLTSNDQLIHGIEKQLPIYMKQERTKKAIYLIIDTGYPNAIKKFLDFYNSQQAQVKEKIPYILIDATSKPSASKA